MKRLTLSIFPAFVLATPLVAQSITSRRILADERFDWQTMETEVARIHVAAGNYAAARRELVHARVVSAWEVTLARLRVPRYEARLDVFYVDSREQMEQLTGRAVTGVADAGSDMVVLVFNEAWRPFERHEFTHIVTYDLWGPPGSPAAPAVEGIAVSVDGRCGGYPVTRVVRGLAEAGALLTPEELFKDFRKQDDLIAYLQASAVVDFVITRTDPSSLRALWTQGLAAAPALLDLGKDRFWSDWRQWLERGWAPIPDDALAKIRAGGCGISNP